MKSLVRRKEVVYTFAHRSVFNQRMAYSFRKEDQSRVLLFFWHLGQDEDRIE